MSLKVGTTFINTLIKSCFHQRTFGILLQHLQFLEFHSLIMLHNIQLMVDISTLIIMTNHKNVPNFYG